MPRLIPIVHEGWLHKPAVSYADALTSSLLLYNLDIES